MSGNPDLILRHIKSLGCEVRLTGDDEHVVFPVHDPKAGQTWVAKGSIDEQCRTVCELASVVGGLT